MKMLKGGYIGWELIDELGYIEYVCCGFWLGEAVLDEWSILMYLRDEMVMII